MLRFDQDWDSTDEPILFDVEEGQELCVEWSSAGVVYLEGLRDDRWILLRAHSGDCRLRSRFRGFTTIQLRTDGEVFGYSVREVYRDQGEPLNDLDPPPPRS